MDSKIRTLTRTIRPPEHHALHGIGKPYPKEFREFILFLHDNYPKALESSQVCAAQEHHVHAVDTAIWTWLQYRNVLGHARPFRRTGNKRATSEIWLEALIDLALFCVACCKAFIYEARAFLFYCNPNIAPYSASQVVRSEQKLDLTRIKASTTACMAYIAVNLEKRRMYWELPYPYGIAE